MSLIALILAAAAAAGQPAIPEACAVLTPEAANLLGVKAASLRPAPDSCAALSADRLRVVSLAVHAKGTGTSSILETLRRDHGGPGYKDLRDEPSLGAGAYSVLWANGRRLIFRAIKDGDRLATLTLELGHEPGAEERAAAAASFARLLKQP